MSTTFLAATGGKGSAFTLPEKLGGVLTGISALSAAITAVNKMIGPCAAASVQVMLDHSMDDSAIVKLAGVLYRDGNAGKSPKYVMYAKFLRKVGIQIQAVQDSEEAVDDTEVTFNVDASDFKKRKKDDKKLVSILEAMWDVAEGEGLINLYKNKKVKKITPAKKKAAEEEQASDADDVDPFDMLMEKSGLKAALSDVSTNDTKKADQIARVLEYVASQAVLMKDTSSLFNEVKQNKSLTQALSGANAGGLITD